MIDEHAMRSVLRNAIERAGSQAAFAAKHDLSPSYISDLLAGRREISDHIARLLGYQRVIRYEPIQDRAA